jgi:hypothetical protein
MAERLCITIRVEHDIILEGDEDIYNEFTSLSYLLTLENNKDISLDIFLYDMQCKENYLFEILAACGISFLKKIDIHSPYGKEYTEWYRKKYNNAFEESPMPISPLTIEDTGNIVLSSSNLDKQYTDKGEYVTPGFTINTENYDETTDEIIKTLCEILSGAGAEIAIK